MSLNKGTKRTRAAEPDRIVEANKKSDTKFIEEHLCPSNSWSSWTHPTTHAIYSLSLINSKDISDDDIEACFRLIEETSRPDYEASSMGWKPPKKRVEMRSDDLRYILVKGTEGVVRGFTSLMPTYEEGEPVVYCYEIHLKPELRGTGLGKLLLSFHENVAVHTPPIQKVMLTCFVSNQKACSFYRAMGFTEDEISPKPKKLRYGRVSVPDYAIMSKLVERVSSDSALS